MPAPSIRRAGHSKKAQINAFTGYVVAGLSALAGVALLVVSLSEPRAFSTLRGAASDVAAPAGEAGAAARVEGNGIVESIAGYFEAGSKNAQLQRQLREAKAKLAEADFIQAENRRLKALLELGSGDQKPVAMARLIGGSPSSIRRFAYVGAGRTHGVAAGMPVVSPNGLVGRVLEAGNSSSRILLLNDSESIVPVRRVNDDVVAFVEGRADGGVQIRLVNLGVNPLKKGDLFVTSGAGGLFRPGIAVAVATEINRDGARGRMLAEPFSTDFVAVMPVWNPELRAASISGVLPREASPPLADGASAPDND